MKNLFTTTILLILSMTLLTTCVTAQSTTGPASATAPAPTTAAQLATALNAMSEGSARVSGSTVTLTRNIGVTRDLTVPAGVTLDITEDNGLWLRDGRTLTVNGTVNTPSNKIGSDDEGGRTAPSITINGNGTINLTGKGQLHSVWSGDGIKRKLTLDGVTLVGIADNDNSLVGVYEGAELVMKSGKITGNTRNGGWGGGVNVGEDGTFTMTGGVISGNSAISDDSNWAGGGGVHVWHGTFTMSGGAISGNSAAGKGVSGIGVNVDEGSIFTMSGGVISGNSGQGNTRDYHGGGGVRVGKGSVFTMSSGEISGNTTTGYGGGVCVRGTFTMTGGTIYGNTALGGGGVDVDSFADAFIMEGGRIQGSTDSDGFTKNTATGGSAAALGGGVNSKKTWGTGGTYTIGGVPQTGGSAIANTNDRLIASPTPTPTSGIAAQTQSPQTTRYALVNAATLNVRSGPSADYAAVGQVTQNTRVQVLESSGAWWRIRAGAVEGWVNSAYLVAE